MKFLEDIEVRQNLHIIARERGKIVTRRDGHNIFCNTGREWLSRLVGYASFSPLMTESNARVRYMGFGIGGNKQLALTTVNDPANPQYTAYAGTNSQADTDPTITYLERPVRFSGGSGAPTAGDVWLGQVGAVAPSDHATATSTTFHRIVLQNEISYSPFNSVQLSEVGLYTSDADPAVWRNTLIAYDTFDTLSKTSAIDLEVVWTLRF